MKLPGNTRECKAFAAEPMHCKRGLILERSNPRVNRIRSSCTVVAGCMESRKVEGKRLPRGMAGIRIFFPWTFNQIYYDLLNQSHFLFPLHLQIWNAAWFERLWGSIFYTCRSPSVSTQRRIPGQFTKPSQFQNDKRHVILKARVKSRAIMAFLVNRCYSYLPE